MRLKCAKAILFVKKQILFVKKYIDCSFYGEIVLNNKCKCFQRINDQF